jgi:hypothetical protein
MHNSEDQFAGINNSYSLDCACGLTPSTGRLRVTAASPVLRQDYGHSLLEKPNHWLFIRLRQTVPHFMTKSASG